MVFLSNDHINITTFQTDGRMDGRSDGRSDGRTDRQTEKEPIWQEFDSY